MQHARISITLLGSLLLHVSLAGWLLQAGSRAPGGVPLGPLAVRLQAAPAILAPKPSRPVHSVRPESIKHVQPLERSVPLLRHAPAPNPVLSTPPSALAAASTAIPTPDTASAPLETSAMLAEPSVPNRADAPDGERWVGLDLYYPNPSLEVPARLRAELLLPELELPEPPAGQSYRLVLRVFVNETGGVDGVELESPDDSAPLSPELFESARRAFARAFYQPGQQRGHEVKSYLRIVVGSEHNAVSPLPPP